MSKFYGMAVGSALLVLGACSSSSDSAQDNQNFFGAKLKDGTLSGSYNPAGFDTELVKKNIQRICKDAKLGGYSEAPTEGGLVAFSATCAAGAKLSSGFMEVERLPSGEIEVEMIGSA